MLTEIWQQEERMSAAGAFGANAPFSHVSALIVMRAVVVVHVKLLQTLTIQFAAQQLQSEAQALVGGSLWVDPDEAGLERSH